MTLLEKITADMKTAMKAKDKEKLTAIRAIKSELLLLQTSGSNEEVTDEMEICILQKLVKQRKDSAEIYKTQAREDLYEKEMGEAKLIEVYLPEQMSEDELKTIIAEIISQTGASSMKDMGKVMGLANKQLAGKAEGKLVAATVKNLLNQ